MLHYYANRVRYRRTTGVSKMSWRTTRANNRRDGAFCHVRRFFTGATFEDAVDWLLS
jgi:hypothetical protein